MSGTEILIVDVVAHPAVLKVRELACLAGEGLDCVTPPSVVCVKRRYMPDNVTRGSLQLGFYPIIVRALVCVCSRHITYVRAGTVTPGHQWRGVVGNALWATTSMQRACIARCCHGSELGSEVGVIPRFRNLNDVDHVNYCVVTHI